MFLPLGRCLVLLALWVQILAPVAAVRAVMAPDDPLVGMTICGHSLADAAAAGTEAGSDRHAAAMPLCGLCCTTIAVLDAPPPSAVGVALAWTVLVFVAPPDGPAGSAAAYVPRARDPPGLA